MESKYKGMNIFQEAKQRKIDGMGYRSRRFKTIWQSKEKSWNSLIVSWGIRWSNKWQLLPVKNVSDNSHRALSFGLWKLYFEISYCRRGTFKQKGRKLFFRNYLWKFYQLVS